MRNCKFYENCGKKRENPRKHPPGGGIFTKKTLDKHRKVLYNYRETGIIPAKAMTKWIHTGEPIPVPRRGNLRETAGGASRAGMRVISMASEPVCQARDGRSVCGQAYPFGRVKAQGFVGTPNKSGRNAVYGFPSI